MNLAEDVEEPPPGDWLELANGGGVMFRDRAELPLQRPVPDRADAQFTSRLSMAKRTSSEDERKPSFWRMMDEVLAIVL